MLIKMLVGCLGCLLITQAICSDETELKVKRQDVFEFAEKPKVTRNGKTVEIAFTSKAACDATIAIEDAKGGIVRHLVSGVLGDNAPAPFKKGSLQQTVVWDGKDDGGEYVPDLNAISIRVSLGLKPHFEKSLFDEPKKRYSSEQQAFMSASKEGVYVYDGGNSVDFLRLYDHDGSYLRTIYPFPADKIKDVKGLAWHEYAEDEKHLPVKTNFLQNSLLTGGTQAFGLNEYDPQENTYRTHNFDGYCHYGMDGRNASAFAVRNGRVAFAHMLLNRIATDGSSGGMTLTGPRTSLLVTSEGSLDHGKEMDVAPRCAALSPDGKTVYLTNYVFSHKTMAGNGAIHHTKWGCFHGVYKLNMDDDSPLQLFAGSQKVDDLGNDNAHFNVPTSLAVDDSGLVYVADYMNDRVQVYSPAGKFERTIKVSRPAQITTDPVHNELIVASFLVSNFGLQNSKEPFPATLTRMGPLSNPVKIATYPIPLLTYVDHIEYHYYGSGDPISIEYDPYGASPMVWVSEEYPAENIVTANHIITNLRLYEIKDKALALKHDFLDDVRKSVVRAEAPKNSRQRLNVNPANGKLYVAEGQCADVFEGFTQILEIDPESGKIAPVEMPFDAEDMCFDRNGLLYLRTYNALARYDMSVPGKWREVPWDYGDEYTSSNALSANCNSGRRCAEAQSALTLPANGSWHSGGMFVALNGNLAVGCNYVPPFFGKLDKDMRTVAAGKPYQPAVYPGRSMCGRGGGIFIHIWDKHGKMIVDDAVRGIADNTYGLGLDTDNNVYALAAATRYFNGKKFFNDMSGTLGKFVAGTAKIISDIDTPGRVPAPLPKSDIPQRSPDFGNGAHGQAWAEKGVEWLFGGVGFCGKNVGKGCACFNCRFAFDYFNRSFAPELDRYSVAVIDGNGNLITRVGQYGNRDSAGARSAVPLGGDEVGLLHGAYVAVHTDKRLFIADPGNGRIVSVRLDYHVSESIALKNSLTP